jgi:hypothetical protein
MTNSGGGPQIAPIVQMRDDHEGALAGKKRGGDRCWMLDSEFRKEAAGVRRVFKTVSKR